VAHTSNPSYLRGWDQEYHGSRPATAKRSQDLISKINRAKETGGVAQALQYLLCKSWVQTPNPTKKEKRQVWGLTTAISDSPLHLLRRWKIRRINSRPARAKSSPDLISINNWAQWHTPVIPSYSDTFFNHWKKRLSLWTLYPPKLSERKVNNTVCWRNQWLLHWFCDCLRTGAHCSCPALWEYHTALGILKVIVSKVKRSLLSIKNRVVR
jgi:hypothetical protein